MIPYIVTQGLQPANSYYPQGIRYAGYTAMPHEYREGNPMLMLTVLYDFGFKNNTFYESHYFEGEISYIGFPREDGGCGSAYYFENKISISASSKVKNSAFSYLKYVLTEYQHYGIGNKDKGPYRVMSGFPVYLPALNRLAEDGLHPAFGPNGTIEDGTHIRTPIQEDIQKIYDLIDSFDTGSDTPSHKNNNKN